MAVISAQSISDQIAALLDIQEQAIAQRNSLIAAQKTANDSYDQQILQARQNISELENQLLELNKLADNLDLIDSLTLDHFKWTQDPATQEWTGTPVTYPGTIGSKLAVFGGSGDAPVLQPATDTVAPALTPVTLG